MKIPNHANKVFKGQIFDVYQWEQKMYDGSKEIFEALKRPATIQIIPTSNDKIYLSLEEQPAKPKCFTFLGGRQEKNEEPLVTAKRELLEEAGMISDDWDLFKTYEAEGKIDWIIYLFIARNIKKISDPRLDPGEKIEVRGVSLNEFLAIVDSPEFWGKRISDDIFRIKSDPIKLKEFKQRLFK